MKRLQPDENETSHELTSNSNKSALPAASNEPAEMPHPLPQIFAPDEDNYFGFEI